MTNTTEYYNKHSHAFIERTADVDMFPLYVPFLRELPPTAHILDAGCGTGRDAAQFQKLGYQIAAFDASAKLAKHAEQRLGQSVAEKRFDELSDVEKYDGIWACASLLHVPSQEMPEAFNRLWAALKPGGVLYCSFKLGAGEGPRDGRHFTDANEQRLHTWVEALDTLNDVRTWISTDQRADSDTQWLNALLFKRSNKLVTGGLKNPFLPHLCAAIHKSNEIAIGVAFVKTTGLRLLVPDLLLALQGGENRTPVSRLRILTSDYLDVTDPEALRLLMLLKERGADIRVHESASTGFHLKAYLFVGTSDGGASWGKAFIGSSNISRQALQTGLEWNYRVDYPGDHGFWEASQRFDELFSAPACVELSDAWIDRYEQRRVVPQQSVEPGSTEKDPPPTPTSIQREALAALYASREEGYQRGLVVLATGLGKTWLAAFDIQQIGARRVLFVAHREEILNQAADTLARINPSARIGFYRGQQRETQVDMLCASIQTLGKEQHLERFSKQYFDYIVVDEFHHAAAPTYHRLLHYFEPAFLLGLTATPDRTDNANILSLCDDNLVYESNLFAGVKEQQLVPFHYYGILDVSVDYKSIPWRNGKFDPELLSNKLATLGRARHALRTWNDKAQSRTLAFCVSRRHADFMARYFLQNDVSAAAVYSDSELSRGEAIEKLASGELNVLFSVDLFNEGVDLPKIDTVMMLRPTESKILFLQQLGRGLRKAQNKDRLVVLDFVANHQSFLHKPMALMNEAMNHSELAAFAERFDGERLDLPDGCYINYELGFINFLKSLTREGVVDDYQSLCDVLGRRPTLTEFYRSGASIQRMRQQHGHWFGLVASQEEGMDESRKAMVEQFSEFLREVETTAMTRSYKMVLLEAFQELGGWSNAPDLELLAKRSWQVLQRRRPLLADLPADYAPMKVCPSDWITYWKRNPIAACCNGRFFSVSGGQLVPSFSVDQDKISDFTELVQELIDYRLATYIARPGNNVVSIDQSPTRESLELSYFPSLKIACGHFRTSTIDSLEVRRLPASMLPAEASRHFIAKASGDSMDGGSNPIHDGDYLLLELLRLDQNDLIEGEVLAIERQDPAGDNQYLLRKAEKLDGTDRLVAFNPAYEDIVVTPDLHKQFRTFARLVNVINPLLMVIGSTFMREEIPGLFGVEFNPGNWHSGHVVLPSANAHILLVTLNKRGRQADLRYHDHWIDEHHFHWQSQNQTNPESRRGNEIIHHTKLGIMIHLFIREERLLNGKAAPFVYHGPVRYQKHEGSKPMSVTFELLR